MPSLKVGNRKSGGQEAGMEEEVASQMWLITFHLLNIATEIQGYIVQIGNFMIYLIFPLYIQTIVKLGLLVITSYVLWGTNNQFDSYC